MSKIDKIYREKLENAEMEFPDHIWENISKELPVKPSEPSKVYWLLGLYLTCGIIIYSIKNIPSWTSNNSEQQQFVESDIDKKDISSVFNLDIPIAKKKTSSSQETSSSLSSAFDGGITLTQGDEEKIEITVINKNPSRIGFARQEIVLSSNRTDLFKAATYPSKFKENNAANLDVSSGIKTNRSPLMSPGYNREIIESLTPLVFQNQISLDERIKSRDDLACEVFKGKIRSNYLSFAYTSSYAMRSLKDKTVSNSELLEARMASETKQYSFSTEFLYGTKLNDNWFAEVGLRYDQINEKFKYLDKSGLHNTTVITIDTIVTATGVDIVTDTVSMVSGTPVEIIGKNRQRRLSIPLNIGYDFRLNRRVSIAAKVGVNLNVISGFKGKVFDEDLEIASIYQSQRGDNPLFKNMVHSVSGSIVAKYRINKLYDMYVGLSAYKYLGEVSAATYKLKQDYNSLGITIGGNYNF